LRYILEGDMATWYEFPIGKVREGLCKQIVAGNQNLADAIQDWGFLMPLPSSARQVLGLMGWLLVVFVAAGIGSAGSAQAGSFYSQLTRPGWAPPSWVFGPVWTFLYFLMGISAWLVWRAWSSKACRFSLFLFLVQLAFNALWSWLFFVWNLGALAFAEVVLLWGLILAAAIAFYRIRALAGVLLIPYLLWVGFASVLSYTLWQLNPSILG